MKYVYYGSVVVLSGLILFFYFLTRTKKETVLVERAVPNIGSVQILNGCGTPGAAQIIADYLRKKEFDVKETENAKDWNYKETIVASRIRDMSTANSIATALHTNNVIMLRNTDGFYDVTVFVGEDYLKITDSENN